MSNTYDVLIVGAGHGGAHAAIALRQYKFSGSIALLGDETELPYERPPLSKDYLAGQKQVDRLRIRPEPFWHAQSITLQLGRRAVAVDPTSHRVHLADGSAIQYRSLIWAAGGRARRLSCSGSALSGVHYVRSLADVDRLRMDIDGAQRIAIVGAGYIGLECASTLRKLRKDVTVIEALDRVLARVAGEPLSRFYERTHVQHGVDLRLKVNVSSIEGSDGRATGVRLTDGSLVPADLVIAGIGILPEIEPLREAGAEVNDGVRIDAQCRTSLPDVFAIGDCASHINAFSDGAIIRLESVQNATDQAATAAKVISGQDARYDALPWFWSEQYDLKLQTVGLSRGHDNLITRGDPEQRSFSVIYLKQDRVVALDCVNAPRDYIQGRNLILHRTRVERSQLSDCDRPLKTLLQPA